MENVLQHIEALIFSSDSPVTLKDIKECLTTAYGVELTNKDIEDQIGELQKKYEDVQFSFKLEKTGGGYQFLTKKDFYPMLSVFHSQKNRKKLSGAALETLSIIAYKQPVTKTELELIRGVNCDYAVHKLLEKDLITTVGRSESPGKPMLYGTSQLFMEHFGINSPDELPKLRDISPDENTNQIGEEVA